MKKDFLLILSLVSLGVLTRTTFHIAPNVEFITAIALISPIFLSNKKLGFVITFLSMLLSDLLIGNTGIFVFTWSAFLITPFLGILVSKIKSLKDRELLRVATLQAGGVFSTIVFFLWTNFGVVVTTSMYPKNLEGLIQSYINALPFLRTQIAGSLLIIPALYLATYLIMNFQNVFTYSARIGKSVR